MYSLSKLKYIDLSFQHINSPKKKVPELSHLLLQAYKHSGPVGPFAHALQRVDEVGEGLGEVRPHHQGPPVRSDRLLVAPGVLISGR